MIKVTIVGAAGRMGRMLVQEVAKDPELQLVGALEVPQCPFLGTDAAQLAGLEASGVKITADPDEALRPADCVVDFTFAASTRVLAPKIALLGKAMVIGSTGLTAEDSALLDDLAAKGARIVQSPNMSVGVNLLFALCAQVAPLLGEDYDIEIVEMHHNQKKYAPSGTAEKLGQILAKARGLDYDKDTRHGRVGLVGARTKHEIGMHSLRGGDVVGDHTVIFATSGERIELTHKASSRQTFALGAMRAVKFLAAAQPGRYDMQDVLHLK
ncbi:MAG: 4-hydroxy-tetrahydrodipicolinate reductase [Victivallales bacterium]|nr:4-hydroxy-tetrahydrodipicolinate reductase [Victivallales bacterium]